MRQAAQSLELRIAIILDVDDELASPMSTAIFAAAAAELSACAMSTASVFPIRRLYICCSTADPPTASGLASGGRMPGRKPGSEARGIVDGNGPVVEDGKAAWRSGSYGRPLFVAPARARLLSSSDVQSSHIYDRSSLSVVATMLLACYHATTWGSLRAPNDARHDPTRARPSSAGRLAPP